MSNVLDRARWHSKFIGYLVQYLEGTMNGMTDEDCEVLQEMIDNPPEHIPPEEVAQKVFVDLAALISMANEYEWATARVWAGERARNPPRGKRRAA